MLRILSSSLADQTPVRLHLVSGTVLEGVVAALGDDELELRHADGARSAVRLASVIAASIR